MMVGNPRSLYQLGGSQRQPSFDLYVNGCGMLIHLSCAVTVCEWLNLYARPGFPNFLIDIRLQRPTPPFSIPYLYNSGELMKPETLKYNEANSYLLAPLLRSRE